MKCRRAHQNTCRGVVHGDLCKYHRALWDAARAEWVERDRDGAPVGLARFGATAFRLKKQPDDDWYVDCPTCRTNAGPLDHDHAVRVRDAHNTAGPLDHDHAAAPKPKPKPKRVKKAKLPRTPRPSQWTPDDDAILRTHPLKDTARILGRTYAAVCQRRNHLGIKAPRHDTWTTHEDHVLATHTTTEAVNLLKGRTLSAIQNRRRVTGTREPVAAKKPWTALEDEIIRNNGVHAAEKLLLGRSRGDVKTRRNHLGISRVIPDAWTPEEDAILTSQPGTSKDLQKLLPHRTATAIANRRLALRRAARQAAPKTCHDCDGPNLTTTGHCLHHYRTNTKKAA